MFKMHWRIVVSLYGMLGSMPGSRRFIAADVHFQVMCT